jgi:hypothetical protein
MTSTLSVALYAVLLRAAHAAFFFTNDKDGKNTECSTTAEIVEPTNYYWVCAKKNEK